MNPKSDAIKPPRVKNSFPLKLREFAHRMELVLHFATLNGYLELAFSHNFVIVTLYPTQMEYMGKNS